MLTLDSKVKALKKSPEATAIIVKYSPGFATDPQMKLVQGLTMRKLLSFPQAGMSEEEIAALEKELLDIFNRLQEEQLAILDQSDEKKSKQR